MAQAAREMVAGGSGARPDDQRSALAREAAAGGLAGGAGLGSGHGRGGARGGRVPSVVGRDAGGPGSGGPGGGSLWRRGGLARRVGPGDHALDVDPGRLAEADMLLACLVTWTVVAFDRLRDEVDGPRPWQLGPSSRGWD